jgi:hypothetical protein
MTDASDLQVYCELSFYMGINSYQANYASFLLSILGKSRAAAR